MTNTSETDSSPRWQDHLQGSADDLGYEFTEPLAALNAWGVPDTGRTGSKSIEFIS
ncbi:MAG: hypothetical protein Ct9H300mP16_12060 [Pseudomonadota bacterium]|nr:MAG: hypothetical protein Ct9H300mP16_12060 [Pseudomonadota bacterium]